VHIRHQRPVVFGQHPQHRLSSASTSSASGQGGRPRRPVWDLDLGVHRPRAACADAPGRGITYARFGFSGCPSRWRSQRGRTVRQERRPASRVPPAGTGVRQQPGRGVAAAERRARQIDVSMFIVVVDDCGVIKMSSRMDDNSPGQRHRGSAQGCDRHRVPDPHRHAGPGWPAIRPGSPRSSVPALAWLNPGGDASRNRLNPQEASNDGTDPVRAARWRLRHRRGG
jgi:hypothetical protein